MNFKFAAAIPEFAAANPGIAAANLGFNMTLRGSTSRRNTYYMCANRSFIFIVC